LREEGEEVLTICHVGCLVDVGARVDPLAGWLFKGASAPCGCKETVMGVYAGGEGSDC
jgi:hypothetical protein